MSFNRSTIADYYQLCKPRVVFLLVVTAIVGMLLAVPSISNIPLDKFILAIIGITLASSSAAAINQIVEQRIDAKMKRTQNRPLVRKTITEKNALCFAILIGVVAEVVLYIFINSLTAIMTFTGLIGYAIIYTLYLKRATPQNIVIGGASGAIPPVLGWSAMSNDISLEPMLLFLIIFIWTPPHFWALAIHRHADYVKAEIPMLTVTHGIHYTQMQVFYYKLLLFAVSLLPYLIGMSQTIYLISAIGLGLWYCWQGWLIIRNPNDDRLPMQSFNVSIWYLALLFLALLIDHWLPIN